MKLLYTIATAALLVTGCTKSSTPAQTGENIIEEGNCITNINGQGITVCFDGLENDSRCPVNAVCVWQGAAVAKFTVKNARQSVDMRLATTKLLPYYNNDTTIMGVHIILKDITPYPGEAGYSLKKKKVKLEIQ